MAGNEEKEKIDTATIYQIASERFNVMQQQAQTAISISTVSVMAYGAAIGAIFASLASAREIYRIYADIFIIGVALLAVFTSFVCIRILDNSDEVLRRYEEKIKDFERQNKLPFMPHNEFYDEWSKVFTKYEPYKATGYLLKISIVAYGVFIIAAIINIFYLLLH